MALLAVLAPKTTPKILKTISNPFSGAEKRVFDCRRSIFSIKTAYFEIKISRGPLFSCVSSSHFLLLFCLIINNETSFEELVFLERGV
jgi:hypothetical protein